MRVPTFLNSDADGWIHFAGHRVGLENVVYLYNQGYSPEMLASEFPSLPLADIHKAIAFYLENRSSVDQYAALNKHDADSSRSAAHSTPSLDELRQRAEAARGAESV